MTPSVTPFRLNYYRAGFSRRVAGGGAAAGTTELTVSMAGSSLWRHLRMCTTGTCRLQSACFYWMHTQSIPD